jgi:hypothetical protein
MSIKANIVSRALRSAGFNPLASGSPFTRQGLRVRQSGTGRVRVTADVDSPREARDLAIAARQALIGAGWTLDTNTGDEAAFYVTKRDN